MDVPPDVTPEPLVAPPPPATPAASPPPASSVPDGVERRLARLEAGLADMNERLDALAVSLEASLRQAVTQEVQTVSGELRHTVAELGRLLVRDLGKLSKLLSEHRDSIVAELGGTPPAAAPAAGPASAAPPPPPAEDGPDTPGADSAVGLYDDEAPSEAGVDGAGDGAEASERQRRSLLRRRNG
jgi:hypothetical protein